MPIAPKMEPVNNLAEVSLLIVYHNFLDLGWLIAPPLFGCRAATGLNPRPPCGRKTHPQQADGWIILVVDEWSTRNRTFLEANPGVRCGDLHHYRHQGTAATFNHSAKVAKSETAIDTVQRSITKQRFLLVQNGMS